MTAKYGAAHSTIMREQYYAVRKRHSDRKQPLYPPNKQPADYLTPTVTKVESAGDEEKSRDQTNKDEKRTNKDDKENPYQSLILTKQPDQATVQDGYVKLTSSCILLEETSPPPVPLVKPDPVCTLATSLPKLESSFQQSSSENIHSSNANNICD